MGQVLAALSALSEAEFQELLLLESWVNEEIETADKKRLVITFYADRSKAVQNALVEYCRVKEMFSSVDVEEEWKDKRPFDRWRLVATFN